jgi:hypothetical protein
MGVSRPSVSVTEQLTPLPERVDEPAPECWIQFFERDIADGGNSAAELLEVVLTAVAFEQVTVEACPLVQIQGAVKVGSNQLDELVAVHRFGRHVVSLR